MGYSSLTKEEKELLSKQKKEALETYHSCRGSQKELDTVCTNVNMILGQPYSRQSKKEKSADIS